jgi:RNA polymerase sigma-70 factor (ECF subfamily)
MGAYSGLSVEELLRQCSGLGDLAAWEEFVRRFHRLIAAVALRTAMRWGDGSRQTVDDLIQETYLRFCEDNYRVLRNFVHRSPDAFVGYVKVVAANVARDHFKSSFSEKRGGSRVGGFADGFVPAAGEESSFSPSAIERSILIDELERHLETFLSGPDRERNSRVFWLYYRVGLTANAISALPGIGLSTKGVESLILRLTRELRERMTVQAFRSHETTTGGAEGILPAESF